MKKNYSLKNSSYLVVFLCSLFFLPTHTQAQEHSIAREWNELLLTGIRNDFARPTVHARNLFHISAAMYDAWAVYDTIARPYFLGNNVNDYNFPFLGVPMPAPEDIEAARREAISYAAYRLIAYRFQNSPGAGEIMPQVNAFFFTQGYDFQYTNINYASGNPADLGNYIAFLMVGFGNQDGANEQNDYANLVYEPVNPPLVTDNPGNPDLIDPNRWQPLTLDVFIDQSGNEIPFNTPPFLSPEWGNVAPFALKNEDLTVANRDGIDWNLYHDPGFPALLDTMTSEGSSAEYLWGFSLVSAWSSHLDPTDTTMWDISPASIGNIQEYPTTFEGFQEFYNFEEGGDPSIGHEMNPETGMPYEPNMVPRGDYTRVLAEFWADGPDSETPPGHWFTVLNYVNDHPLFEKRYRGQGEIVDDLEWDIKAYLALGGALHDVAVTTWGLKGYYDYIRPVSAIRKMADYGQSTDTLGSQYHPAGFPLVPGLIDTVVITDPFELQGEEGANIGKVKLYAWRGPDAISNPATDVAGVDWILAENWWPYQRPSFVTPNFAGYLSGHSTFSSAAAQVLETITGSAYFPGGMGVFDAVQNQFLVFEEGPSQDITLQWATYRDASDQTSLSRIWGGIHPPVDDIPGRFIGIEIGNDAVDLAETYFFIDADQDGFFFFEDCDDNNAMINPDAVETCDGIDNNCDGTPDEGLLLFTYFRDADGDGFGDAAETLDTCAMTTPAGFVINGFDCDDTNAAFNPDAPEICDGEDNNCNGLIDDDIPFFTYYADTDNDGYGDAALSITTCADTIPANFVADDTDCDDFDPAINPGSTEICDDIDNNCDGQIDEELEIFTYYTDNDADGFGVTETAFETCSTEVPLNTSTTAGDCDDNNPAINPNGTEIANNGIDEDCDGMDLISSITEIDGNTFNIFPNPARHFLTIEFSEMSEMELTIYDITGQKIKRQTANSVSQTIDLQGFANGVYLLEIVSTETANRVVRRFEVL